MFAPAANLHGGAYPVRDGNQFTPLVDILPTYRAICAAADSAQRSVWVAISFIDPHWQLPDKRGTALEYLELLARRGLDVRILAWNNPAFYSGGFLRADQALPHFKHRESRIKVRWDHSPDERHCHHEKTWIIDGLTLLEPGRSDSCVGFTGGIVIGGPLTGPDHAERTALRHDIFSCLTGPSATDLVHSFVQRWNGARGPKGEPLVCYPSEAIANALPYPNRLSTFRAGSSRCQVLRTICSEHYRDPGASVIGGVSHDITKGEDSIYLAYQQAILSAKRYVYIENQHAAHEGLLAMLLDAMNRGVYVLYVVPGDKGIVGVLRAEKDAAELWAQDKTKPRPWYAGLFLETFPRLAKHPNFLLCGLRSDYGDWIYVHSKLMIVDDEWLTLGSANFVDISFEKDHTEVNVACWDPTVARNLRHALLCEHQRQNAAPMALDGRTAIAVAMQEARSNAAILAHDAKGKLSGRLVAIDPATYGAGHPSAAPRYQVRYPPPGKF